MLDKLQTLEARYDKLLSMIADPAVQADPAEYRTHTKAVAEIQETIDVYRQYKTLLDEQKQAQELAASGDPDMEGLAQEELKTLVPKREAMEQQLRILLTPRDPNDE